MLVTRTLLAVGFVGAIALASPAPTLAQGVYIGPGGVGLDTGRPGWRERHYRDHNYAYEREDSVVVELSPSSGTTEASAE